MTGFGRDIFSATSGLDFNSSKVTWPSPSISASECNFAASSRSKPVASATSSTDKPPLLSTSAAANASSKPISNSSLDSKFCSVSSDGSIFSSSLSISKSSTSTTEFSDSEFSSDSTKLNAPAKASSAFSDSFLESITISGSAIWGRGTIFSSLGKGIDSGSDFTSGSDLGNGIDSGSDSGKGTEEGFDSTFGVMTFGSSKSVFASTIGDGTSAASTADAFASPLAKLEIGVTCPATSKDSSNSLANCNNPSLFAAGLLINDSIPTRYLVASPLPPVWLAIASIFNNRIGSAIFSNFSFSCLENCPSDSARFNCSGIVIIPRCPATKKYISPPSHESLTEASSKSNSPGFKTKSDSNSRKSSNESSLLISIILCRASEDSNTPKYAAASSTSIPSGNEAP